jgi:hypothetical protein
METITITDRKMPLLDIDEVIIISPSGSTSYKNINFPSNWLLINIITGEIIFYSYTYLKILQPTIGNNITLSFTNPVKYEYIPVDYIHLKQVYFQCYIIAGLQATKPLFRFMDDAGMLPENGKKIYDFLNTGVGTDKIYDLCKKDGSSPKHRLVIFSTLTFYRYYSLLQFTF